MAETYEKPDKILVGDTKDILLKIRCFFEVPSKKRSMKIKYNLILEIKDEKVKVTINNIENSGGIYYTNFFDKKGKIKEKEQFGVLIEDVDSYVNKFVNNNINYLNRKDNR